MATQKYMRRDTLGAPSSKDPTKTVAQRGAEMGLNQSTGTAGRNKTPAPVREATPDQLRSTSFGRGNYGANANAFPASIEPGTQVTQKGVNIDALDGDEAMDLVQQHGTALGGKDPAESWQTEPEETENVPPHPAMKRQQNPDLVFGKAKPSLPASETDNETQPVRKPD